MNPKRRPSNEELEAFEVIKRIEQRLGGSLVNLSSLCFPEQLAFLQDGAAFVTGVTSRRSGKSTGCALDLLKVATQYQKIVCLYITLSRVNASRLVWPILKEFNKSLNLGGVANETQLSLTFPNGSIIYCSGAKDRKEIEKFRGLALKLCYIDEAQSFPAFLEELIDDVIAPALLDYAGTLKLIGTPGPVPTGIFHKIAHSPEWSHHAWTFFNNPWIASKSGLTHQQLLERELKRKGVSVDDPSIQREFFGKWVLDTNSLVYRYDNEKNHYEALPSGPFTHILGIDLGFEDCDALSLLGWSEFDPCTYLFEENITPKQGITELVAQIESLRSRYDISKIVMDTGGLGKKVSEEIIRRWKISIIAADKARKLENIELFNDALRTKMFKAKKSSRFAQDCMLVEWDFDKSTPDKRVISDRYHSDICDATLYAWKESFSFTSAPVPKRPDYGTKEYWEQEAQKMEEAAEEHFKQLEEQNGNSSW